MRAKLAAVILAWVTGCNAEASPPLIASKIIPPPGGGMYLGQHQWRADDMSTFEAAAGQAAASFGNVEYNTDLDVMFWDDVAQRITFNVAHAESAWQAGKMILVFAYEATPEPNPFIPGFTVDRLLSGEFDADLSALAAEFRAFGKPMFFQTSREPNGADVHRLITVTATAMRSGYGSLLEDFLPEFGGVAPDPQTHLADGDETD